MMLLLARLEALEDKVVAVITNDAVTRLGVLATVVAGAWLGAIAGTYPAPRYEGWLKAMVGLGAAMGWGSNLAFRKKPEFTSGPPK